MKTKGRKILEVLLVVLAVFVGILVIVVFRQKGEIDGLDRSPVEISQVKDGVYQGKSETSLIKVEVEVKVEDGKLMEVKILRHEHGRGAEAEKIVDKMVQDNSVEVDSISAATLSSEVIKDAVRKALRGA